MIRVWVQDVNGEAINDCRVQLRDDVGGSFVSQTSPREGVVWNTGGARVRVEVEHPAYQADALNATTSPLQWDLPTARLIGTSAGIDIIVPLCRVSEAPTYEVHPDRLKVEAAPPKASEVEKAAVDKRNAHQLITLNEEVRGVLAERHNGARDRYLWLTHERTNHEQADAFVTVDLDKRHKRVLASAKAAGWARFVTKRSRTDTASQGQFWLVEYGVGSSRSRRPASTDERPLLVAVFIPDMEAGTTSNERDVLLFLPPNTAKAEYQVAYPYGLNIDGERFVQPFVSRLGVGYPYGRYHLPHQMLAMGKKAILVLPVWPTTGPGILLNTSGILRLLREVLHFAHRNGFIGIRRAATPTYSRDVRKFVPLPELRVQKPVPALGCLAIAAYSAGGSYLTSLLNGNDQKLTPMFSVPASAKPQFGIAWRETFDIDCIKSSEMDAALVRWKGNDSRRGVRVFWTGWTGRTVSDLANRPGGAAGPLRSLVDAPVEPAPDITNELIAHEIQGSTGKFSALVTNLAYLKPQTGNDVPLFSWSSDPHQFAPNLGIAWAVGCSSLR